MSKRYAIGDDHIKVTDELKKELQAYFTREQRFSEQGGEEDLFESMRSPLSIDAGMIVAVITGMAKDKYDDISQQLQAQIDLTDSLALIGETE